MRYFSGVEFADPRRGVDKIPVVSPDRACIDSPGNDPQATWIGHSTVLIQYKGINILTDPIFSERASPFGFMGPKRFTPPALTIDQLPPIDFVLISHSHYDHLDLPSVRGIGARPAWLVPLGLREWLVDAGIPAEKVWELDWWETKPFMDAKFTAAPLQHWSSRTPWDRNQTLWVSWIVQIGDFSVWFGGDTGYNGVQFKEIGRRFGGFDLALIPIGAYAPRWFMKSMHVDPAEAAAIFKDVHARRALPIHWGTFQLSAEPVDEPPRRLLAALAAEGIPQAFFKPCSIGETLVISDPMRRWPP
jgi:N-acyl-phosphatidylethanolamine-hydrolysing phospholipase D